MRGGSRGRNLVGVAVQRELTGGLQARATVSVACTREPEGVSLFAARYQCQRRSRRLFSERMDSAIKPIVHAVTSMGNSGRGRRSRTGNRRGV